MFLCNVLYCACVQVKEITKEGSGSTMGVSLVPNTDEGKPQVIQGVDCVLWAVGREANADGLGLGVAGVKCDKRGFICVDEYQNTSVQGIYALGDIAGNKLLTPGEYV